MTASARPIGGPSADGCAELRATVDAACAGAHAAKEAFERGGYETTFALSSRLAPEAGDILADAAISLIRQGL